MEKQSLILIIAISSIALSLTLGQNLNKDGGVSKKQETLRNLEGEVNVLNLYNNTDELIKEFKVINPTTVKDGLEKHIQNRLLTGFANWNRGFDTWKAWGNILYTKESIYNVHGARLTLEHYQEDMYETLGKMKIDMGNFNNMLIVGDYCAIYYDIKIGSGSGTTMEFVQFKDYGDATNPDVRVVEGWGGVKDATYYDSIQRQGSAEKKEQEEQNNFLLTYTPEGPTLAEKYFVKLTSITANEDTDNVITNMILNGFESWNTDINTYLTWVDNNFAAGATSKYGNKERTKEQYREEIKTLFQNEEITKLYFDNFLIRDNWAAIHYRFRSVDQKNTKTRVGDRMEFFKFDGEGAAKKIVGNWLK